MAKQNNNVKINTPKDPEIGGLGFEIPQRPQEKPKDTSTKDKK